MNKTTTVRALGVCTASTLLITACSSGATTGNSKSTNQGPKNGGSLVIDRDQDAKSMNNILTFDNRSIFVQEQIMQTLFTVTKNGKSTKPLLAKSYHVSKDKKTYKVKLKKGIEFSTGKPMTSKDVKFSIDQDTKHAKDGWGFINSAIRKVETPNKHTVKFTLKHPWAPFIADLSLFSNAVVPYNYDGKSMKQFYKAPIGTGPFKWGEWKHGNYLKIVKNNNYWEKGLPHLDSVTWKVVPDDNTRKLQTTGGQADIDEYPGWSILNSEKNSQTVNAKTFPATEIDSLAFNENVKPFQDVHVRRAIAAMINRKAMIKAVLLGNGKVANSSLMPGVPFYDKNTPGITHNPKLAKAELKKSSVPHGFSTSLLIHSGDSDEEKVAEIIQQDLKKYGIKVKIKKQDPTATHKQQAQMNYKMTFSVWTMDIPDPDQWTSFMINPHGSSKSVYTGYDNPKAVKLNKKAQVEVNKQKRAKLYKKLQAVVAHDEHIAPLYYPPYGYLVSKTVHKFHVTPLGNYPLKGVWKQKK
jgi:peptide/nickel transport system substrate-binding protein